MSGRTWNDTTAYRYGFNGKEKDANGEWGNTAYDYGFRVYDPSIGRFKSRDPLANSYPWYTPYQFAGNKPIMAVDVDGLEDQVAIDGSIVSGPFNMNKINSEIIRQQVNSVRTVMSQQSTSRSPNVPTIGPDPFKGEAAALYKHMRSDAIYEANLRRLENHLTPYEKAGVFAVDVASAIEGEYGLAKFTLSVPKHVKNYLAMSKLARQMTKNSSSIDIVVATKASDIKYLDEYLQAEASYMKTEKGGSILIREGADRPTILEEIIHHNQTVNYGEDFVARNRIQIEIEAQDILLEVGKIEKWTPEQMDRIRRAKEVWMNESKKVKR